MVYDSLRSIGCFRYAQTLSSEEMNVIWRLLTSKSLPADIAQDIIETIRNEVAHRQKFRAILQDISSVYVPIKLSQRDEFFGYQKPHDCVDSYCIMARADGRLNYHTKWIIDISSYSSVDRRAIFSYNVYHHTDGFNWTFRIVRMKSDVDDYPKVLMIETCPDVHPDIMRDETDNGFDHDEDSDSE